MAVPQIFSLWIQGSLGTDAIPDILVCCIADIYQWFEAMKYIKPYFATRSLCL